jgi:hypothetical protein
MVCPSRNTTQLLLATQNGNCVAHLGQKYPRAPLCPLWGEDPKRVPRCYMFPKSRAGSKTLASFFDVSTGIPVLLWVQTWRRKTHVALRWFWGTDWDDRVFRRYSKLLDNVHMATVLSDRKSYWGLHSSSSQSYRTLKVSLGRLRVSPSRWSTAEQSSRHIMRLGVWVLQYINLCFSSFSPSYLTSLHIFENSAALFHVPCCALEIHHRRPHVSSRDCVSASSQKAIPRCHDPLHSRIKCWIWKCFPALKICITVVISSSADWGSIARKILLPQNSWFASFSNARRDSKCFPVQLKIAVAAATWLSAYSTTITFEKVSPWLHMFYTTLKTRKDNSDVFCVPPVTLHLHHVSPRNLPRLLQWTQTSLHVFPRSCKLSGRGNMFLLPTRGYTTIHRCASCLKFSCPKDSAIIPMFFSTFKDRMWWCMFLRPPALHSQEKAYCSYGCVSSVSERQRQRAKCVPWNHFRSLSMSFCTCLATYFSFLKVREDRIMFSSPLKMLIEQVMCRCVTKICARVCLWLSESLESHFPFYNNCTALTAMFFPASKTKQSSPYFMSSRA